MKKIDYSYSSFEGKEFIVRFLDERKNFLEKNAIYLDDSSGVEDFDFDNYHLHGVCGCRKFEHEGAQCTWCLVESLGSEIKEKESSVPFRMLRLLQKIEVSQCVYEAYSIDLSKNFGVLDRFEDVYQVLKLFMLGYKITGKLQFLNIVLKLNDIAALIFPDSKLRESSRPVVVQSMLFEYLAIKAMVAKLGGK